MNNIQEVRRLASPAPKPQSLAWEGSILWMGSRDTKVIHALNPVTWTVGWQATAPGIPWGMTAMKGELRVICGETADDHRIIRRCVPGQGFDATFGITCPDDTGSHLSYDGRMLYVSQWYPKKLIAVGEDGKAGRVIQVTRGICGHTWVDGVFFLMTTDAEETNDYWLTRVDPRPATPKIDDLAKVPFPARGLAFDGKNFWTNHRAADQIVCFERPD